MVSYAVEEIKEKITGVICPQCYHHLPWPSIVDNETDRYGRKIRTYFGWCFKCSQGYEVIQFQKNDRWHVHKYQPYKIAGENVMKPSGNWTVVNELPEPPFIVTGPGGDYDKASKIDEAKSEILAAAARMATAITEALGKFTEAVKEYAEAD